MNIKFILDPSTNAAPAAFFIGLQSAAAYLDNLIVGNFTFQLEVGYGDDAGNSVGTSLATGAPIGHILPYATVVADLRKFATSIDDAAALKYIAALDPTHGNGIFVSNAEEKAWGILPATQATVDGSVGFSTTLPFSYSQGAIEANTYDFVGIAEHEIAHALGRYASDGDIIGQVYTVMDLFRYTADGQLATSLSQPAYFSLDGGHTDLVPFDATGADPADWSGVTGSDAFDAFLPASVPINLSPADVRLMDVLGFNVGAPTPPAPPVPPPAPPPPAPSPQFNVTDLTTGQYSQTAGTPYTGTMPGITSQYISPNADSTLIGSPTPDVFLYASGHFNNFYLANNSGTNIMDGGTSSDLMTGGTGLNYFFADDLNSSGPQLVWDTASNFHSGDIAAIWGIDASFNIKWVSNIGNPGYAGDTVEITKAGKPEVCMDFAGYGANAETSGQLQVSFATSGGTPLLRIEAT